MEKPSKLDYLTYLVSLQWKDPNVNKLKIEVINGGYGFYSVKETILNPYTYEDYCLEQELLQKQKNNN